MHLSFNTCILISKWRLWKVGYFWMATVNPPALSTGWLQVSMTNHQADIGSNLVNFESFSSGRAQQKRWKCDKVYCNLMQLCTFIQPFSNTSLASVRLEVALCLLFLQKVKETTCFLLHGVISCVALALQQELLYLCLWWFLLQRSAAAVREARQCDSTTAAEESVSFGHPSRLGHKVGLHLNLLCISGFIPLQILKSYVLKRTVLAPWHNLTFP